MESRWCRKHGGSNRIESQELLSGDVGMPRGRVHVTSAKRSDAASLLRSPSDVSATLRIRLSHTISTRDLHNTSVYSKKSRESVPSVIPMDVSS